MTYRSQHTFSPNNIPYPNSTPQGPRHNYAQYDSRRDTIPPAQLVRLNAQLLKAKHDLDVERNRNTNLRKTIETQQQQNLEAAFSSMLTTLLREQTEALALKAQAQAKQHDLEHREKKIAQQEIFLSEGQKQLMYKLGENSESTSHRPASAIQLQHTRRQTELDVRKHLADLEAHLTTQSETLTLRAAAQAKRETQYKRLIRPALEAEIKAQYALSVAKAEQLAATQYQRGFEQGQEEAGRKHTGNEEEAREKAFLQGYEACFVAQAVLSKLRGGHDGGGEVSCLIDPAHPDNVFSMGVRIGMARAGKNVLETWPRREDEAGCRDVKEGETKGTSTIGASGKGEGNTHFTHG
jgi:hypothetical protein